MLPDSIFHHIGMAVYDIEATAAVYVQGGYHRSSTIYDPVQNVNICWLEKDGMPLVELLEPVDETSPVCKILEKNGVTPYHTCYVVENIENSIAELKKQKYVTLSNPEKAVAINGCRVCFMFNRNIGLIELVETPANITR